GCIAVTKPVHPQSVGKSLKKAFKSTAIEPAIVIGIVEINASRKATKCFCEPIFAATGTKYFSKNAVNPFILYPPIFPFYLSLIS
ncbi:conserved hypothetical protein, partial [Listeria ivanovii FSL F6-596]